MKSSEVSIKTRSTPASLTIQGQVTKDTTVKLTDKHNTCTYMTLQLSEGRQKQYTACDLLIFVAQDLSLWEVSIWEQL